MFDLADLIVIRFFDENLENFVYNAMVFTTVPLLEARISQKL
ncbi:hypothetical protein EV05_1029 [Prochlorococcus sp. MIT 0601]|nr:hypothetical protein EV05_1029 [Prochlorococcus sp. MIT 0601]